MTAATAIGLIILAAPIVLMVVVIAPLLWQLHRSVSAVEDDWARISATVEAARADIDRDALAVLHGPDTYSAAAAVLAPELIAETEAHLSEVAR